MTLGERIKAVRESQPGKLSRRAFGEPLAVSQDVIANLEFDRVSTNEPLLKLISQTYRVDYRWLCTGEGDMTIAADTVEQAVGRFMAGASEFQRSTFKALADMGDDQWIWLEKLVDSIAGQKKGD